MKTEGETRQLIEALRCRQDQHMTMWTTLEAIRWKFLTGFGAGALLGLFLTYSTKFSQDVICVATCLVAVLSFAGLLTQIRIYSIVTCIWDRIRALQTREANLLNGMYQQNTPLLGEFLLPQITHQGHSLYHCLTVHMACCSVFCALVALGFAAPWLMHTMHRDCGVG
jgi:NhaP-type Na+/H+ or K+/H+ antiporter